MKTIYISGYSMNMITYVFQAQSNCQAITICQGNTLDSQGHLTRGHLLLPCREAGLSNSAAQLSSICSEPKLQMQVSLTARSQRAEGGGGDKGSVSAPGWLKQATAAGVLFRGKEGPRGSEGTPGQLIINQGFLKHLQGPYCVCLGPRTTSACYQQTG